MINSDIKQCPDCLKSIIPDLPHNCIGDLGFLLAEYIPIPYHKFSESENEESGCQVFNPQTEIYELKERISKLESILQKLIEDGK